MQKSVEKLVPDTSVIIQGLVSEQISTGELQIGELILHEAVLAELEHQANAGKASGYLGLDEVKRLQEMSVKKTVTQIFRSAPYCKRDKVCQAWRDRFYYQTASLRRRRYPDDR
jgi:predicted PilT family ATPase